MAQASLLLGVRHLPGPGIEPVSLALQGGFLTTGPSGRPQYHLKSHASEGASLLVSVLGEALSFSPLSVVMAVGALSDSCYQVEKVPLYFLLIESFIMNGCCIQNGKEEIKLPISVCRGIYKLN